jgi:hypothetical protein
MARLVLMWRGALILSRSSNFFIGSLPRCAAARRPLHVPEWHFAFLSHAFYCMQLV